ncbi:MAG: alpha/beta fold hydrolase [Planctomycetota bacterium]
MDSVQYQLEMSPERIIRGTIELPGQEHWPAPVVIFCHGFKGFKDWGGWPWFTRSLAERGFVVNRLNFSLAGVGESLDCHDEPEKFARNTFGAELDDLHFLLKRVDAWGVPSGALGSGLGLVGHSRGGMVSLLFAAEEPRVDTAVTLAAPGHSDRFPPDQKQLWRQQGYLEMLNARTGQVLRMDVSILDDYEAHRDRYDVERALSKRSVPTLVIHGEEDESVGINEASFIYGALQIEAKELVKIPDTGHTFGTVHPFAGPTPAVEEGLHRTARWLQEHLPR